MVASVSLLLIVSCDKEEETKPTPIENNDNGDDTGDDNGDNNGDDTGDDNGDNNGDDNGDDNGDVFFNPNITYGSMNDIEGNTYKTVVIGTQTWMAENLKVTKYNDGASIPNVTEAGVPEGSYGWRNLTTPAYCWHDNDINKSTYGALYNWYAVETEKLCPTGWHVPSDEEWTVLTNYLAENGYNYDGTIADAADSEADKRGKIAKAMASSSGWVSVSSTGSVGDSDFSEYRNKSGFTALPGGSRFSSGNFNSDGNYGYWWSATEGIADNAWTRGVDYRGSNVYRNSNNKEVGFSVRCVRD